MQQGRLGLTSSTGLGGPAAVQRQHPEAVGGARAQARHMRGAGECPIFQWHSSPLTGSWSTCGTLVMSEACACGAACVLYLLPVDLFSAAAQQGLLCKHVQHVQHMQLLQSSMSIARLP